LAFGSWIDRKREWIAFRSEWVFIPQDQIREQAQDGCLTMKKLRVEKEDLILKNEKRNKYVPGRAPGGGD
jgi:hypothetical protein